jgi:hypothetical protein
MNLASHLSSLFTKKSQLDEEIKFEMQRPLPNFLKLSELKRKKMAVKTEIVAFEKQQNYATS